MVLSSVSLSGPSLAQDLFDLFELETCCCFFVSSLFSSVRKNDIVVSREIARVSLLLCYIKNPFGGRKFIHLGATEREK